MKTKNNDANKPYFQDQQAGIVDYQYFKAPGGSLYFRGPMPSSLEKDSFFTCIGAAQTFGRFCEKPFCQILSEEISLPCLNLGYAGAGPSFFLINDYLFELINKSRFVIVQAMSGRSESNSHYHSYLGRNILKRVSDQSQIIDTDAYNEILRKNSLDLVRKIVQETRYSWLRNTTTLLERIQPKTCLLWFSERKPEYKTSFNSVQSLFSKFPQLVDESLMDAVKVIPSDYVECVSSIGLPQKLVKQNSQIAAQVSYGYGDKVKTSEYNKYYPSPEMHVEAAKLLLPICEKLVKDI